MKESDKSIEFLFHEYSFLADNRNRIILQIERKITIFITLIAGLFTISGVLFQIMQDVMFWIIIAGLLTVILIVLGHFFIIRILDSYSSLDEYLTAINTIRGFFVSHSSNDISRAILLPTDNSFINNKRRLKKFNILLLKFLNAFLILFLLIIIIYGYINIINRDYWVILPIIALVLVLYQVFKRVLYKSTESSKNSKETTRKKEADQDETQSAYI